MEWNDCFDGCDNFYTWKFKVGQDCTVDFLGIEEGGAFGIEELPDPLNCMITDIDESLTPVSKIEIFPNPAREELNISSGQDEGTWTIFNTQGQLIKQGQTATPSISLIDINPGIYWIRFSNNEREMVDLKSFIKH